MNVQGNKERRTATAGVMDPDVPDPGLGQRAFSNAVVEELVSRNIATVVRLPAPRKPQRQSWSADRAGHGPEPVRGTNSVARLACSPLILTSCKSWP